MSSLGKQGREPGTGVAGMAAGVVVTAARPKWFYEAKHRMDGKDRTATLPIPRQEGAGTLACLPGWQWLACKAGQRRVGQVNVEPRHRCQPPPALDPLAPDPPTPRLTGNGDRDLSRMRQQATKHRFFFASRIRMHWEAVTFLFFRGPPMARPTGQASRAGKVLKVEPVELQACWPGGAGNRCGVWRCRPEVRT